jgi:hypothetical protein
MLPEFKCKRGDNDAQVKPLFLTTALNCESIRLVYKAKIWLPRVPAWPGEGLQLRNSP